MVEKILLAILLALSVIITASVLLQPGKTTGFSTAISGTSEQHVGGKRKKRSEVIQHRITLVSSILFLALCIIVIIAF